MRRTLRTPFLVLGLSTALLAPACDGGPSASEAMKKADDKPDDTPVKHHEAPPETLPPPTDAELKAWDRKDPEGEKHLYKWDKRNIKKMWNYWQELQCFREKMKENGAKAFGAEPQSPEDEQWYQFKRVYIPFVNRWQQRLFANEPRILEKSKFISLFLEAHELVMNGYPKAYNNGDETLLKKQDAHWLIVEKKMTRYTEQLVGEGKYKMPDKENPKELAKWQKFCDKANAEPKKGKGPKKIKEKTPI